MAITYVQSMTPTLVAKGTGEENVSLPVSQENDVWVVIAGRDDSTFETTAATTAGWTVEYNSTGAGSVRDHVLIKRMGATPDTTVPIDKTNTGEGETSVIGQCFRGVDTVTLNDVASATTTTAISATPDSGSLTTVTDGAMVISLFIQDDNGGSTTLTSIPSGYADPDYEFYSPSGTGVTVTVGMAHKIVSTAGVEDPGAWTLSGSETWDAFTIALRPDSGVIIEVPLGPIW